MTDSRDVVVVPPSDRAGTALADELATRLPDAPVTVADADADEPAGLASASVVLAMNLDEEQVAAAPELAWVHALTAGVDHFPTESLRERGVVFTNASGVHAEPIGEQVLGYLLAFERNLHRAVRQQARGEWDRYRCSELRDRTVGVVGVGAIGSRVADLCSAVGSTVVGTKRDPSTAPESVDEAYGPDGLGTVLDRADYVVLACPLTDETRGLLGPEEFDRMDDSAVLVNVARGEVVDHDAMVDALREERIGGAALDVFPEEPLPGDSPLWGMDHVVVTPHVAGSTPHYWERNADLVAENYPRFVAGDHDSLTNRLF